jgi:UDP-N-acetylglucosamine--N-acetylmuramyl-(pentapeptide) pyrophosphoryl-undecaprenol N-acetylglucosamine transferase
MKKILLVAGGTGGHYFPAEALLEELTENNYITNLITDKRCEQYISYPEFTKIIDTKKLSGSKINKILGLIYLPTSIIKSILFIIKFEPNLLISFGGYTSIPHLIAATILRIPIILHEQNSIIGKANLLFCKLAKIIMLSYKNTINLPNKYKTKSIFTGNFIRKKFRQANKSQNTKFIILVIGGSQGAQIFSKEITDAIINLSYEHKDIKVIQQVVQKDLDSVKEIYIKNGIEAEIETFFSDIDRKYSEADLIIARSGATTIAEIISLSKPSILIPMPSSVDNHQYFNAKLLEDKEATILIEQKNINNQLYNILNQLINNPKQLIKMQNSLKKLQINGTQILFNAIKKII